MAQEGDIAVNRRTGQRAVFRNGQWIGEKMEPQGDASQRGRLGVGMGPMVQAQQNLAAAERGGNPLDRDWGAAIVDGLDDSKIAQWAGISTGPAARAIGGEDYQAYTQAAKAFEAQLMPFMSGAAVSPSEAQRQIRASLPQMGDSPEILRRKSRDRAMMLNGAARMMGAPLPYPDVPTYGLNTMQVPQAQQGGGQRRLRFNPKTGEIE